MIGFGDDKKSFVFVGLGVNWIERLKGDSFVVGNALNAESIVVGQSFLVGVAVSFVVAALMAVLLSEDGNIVGVVFTMPLLLLNFNVAHIPR